MNIECRISKYGILCIYIKSEIARAQRFHTSKFCGSIFDILRFAFNVVSHEDSRRFQGYLNDECQIKEFYRLIIIVKRIMSNK